MRQTRKRWLIGSVFALLVVGVVSVRAGNPLPADLSASQIDADIKYLKATLAKPPKGSEDPLKSTAMLLARNAHNQVGGTDGEKMAGVRDDAIRIAEALNQKKPADALKIAEKLGESKGDVKKEVKLHAQAEIDLQQVMSVYKPGNRGGRNYENTLKAQASKVTDVKLAAELAAQTVLIAEYTAALPPSNIAGAKEKEKEKEAKWAALSADMLKAGVVAAEEAAKGEKADKAELAKKLKAINANCTACHNDFRDN